MIVKQLEATDLLTTNVYFYIDEKTKHAFLIDPATEAQKILDFIKNEGLVIEKILITHGHFDHIGAVQEISEALDVPYFAHEAAKDYFLHASMNLSSFFSHPFELQHATYFSEGEKFFLSTSREKCLRVIHTPGHTEDSVIYIDDKEEIAFVGDTIFKNGVGRTDMPGGSAVALKDSLLNKIFTLPENTVLYSGHSEATTVGAEK